jgi:hypothetical protein
MRDTQTESWRTASAHLCTRRVCPGGGFSDATALVQERAERGEFGVKAGPLAGVAG